MNLYVIRHGEAAAIGGAVKRDVERPLTEKGQSDAKILGEALSRHDPQVGLILCSPFHRARQTAETVAACFSMRPKVSETEHLAPGFRPKPLLEELSALAPEGSAAIIGHQPDLTMFIAYVIESESAASITMPPAAVAKVTFAAGPTSEASLQWLLNPEILRQILPPR
jgi:phosphohistidine phosphatase